MFQNPKANSTHWKKTTTNHSTSNRKVGELKILCEDALSINLTLSQFISKSIDAIKRSWIQNKKI